MPKGVRKDFLNEEEFLFLKNNVGKMQFTKIARHLGMNTEKLKNICEENQIYYSGQKYKQWEIDILLNSTDLTFKEIHNKFLPHRTTCSINYQCSILGIHRRKDWSDSDIEFLKENYSNMDIDEISSILNRPLDGIFQKASQLKLLRRNILSHQEYCEYIKNNSSIVVEDGIYTNMNCFLKFRCLIHDYVWEATSRSVYRTLRCPRCHINKKRTLGDFVHELFLINPDIEIIGDFLGTKEKIKARCKVHDFIWDAIPHKLLLGRGCPICSASHGERKIKEFLCGNHISFMPQKWFDDCRGVNSGVLKFDFCIYENDNIKALIEFQGMQHYEALNIFGGEKGYIKRKKHDRYKRYYCKQKNIPLIIIPYWKFDDIYKILERKLFPLLKGG